MRKNWKQWSGTGLAVLGAVLSGCGGDGQTAADAAAAPVLRVEGVAVSQATNAATASPVKLRAVEAAPVPSRIVLGALESNKALLAPVLPGARMVGEARAVSAAATVAQTLGQLQWRSSSTGGQVAALSISAKDALGLRLGVQIAALPESAVLRVYSQNRLGTVFQISGKDVLLHVLRNTQATGDSAEARTWWTPDIGSDEVTLEVELPAGVAGEAVQIAVPTVSHIFTDLDVFEDGVAQAKINESESCNQDAVCDSSFATQSNAVARMLFTSGGNSYACSGTLLNDAKNSGTPYFLSANHCISTQTAASSLQTDWFYRASACNSRRLSSTTTKLYNGATLLYASSSTDVSLLRLNDSPPAGAYFAGWDATGSAMSSGTSIVGLHHPAADMLKISKGQIAGQTTCVATEGNQFGCTGASGNFYMVGWSSGTTQGGSSGSAIFSSDGRYVLGNLYGGGATCTNRGALDYYGRFDVSYAQGLKNWLGGQSTPPSGGGGVAALDNIVRILQSLRGN